MAEKNLACFRNSKQQNIPRVVVLGEAGRELPEPGFKKVSCCDAGAGLLNLGLRQRILGAE